MCCVRVLQRGYSGDGCELVSTLCKVIICSELGKGATNEVRKCLIRAANVW